MSKFKKGDKVRMLVDKSAGAPNHTLHINLGSMLGKGQVGEVWSTEKREWGTACWVAGPNGGKYYYDEDWLELVEDEPEKPKHMFKKGDIVEFVGSRVEYATAPKGPVEISDITDSYVYIQGDKADSGRGWLPEQFKLAETIPTKPKQKFKDGDFVICVNATACEGDVLVKGRIYKVTHAYERDEFVSLYGLDGTFLRSRFAPLNSPATTVLSIDEATTLTLGEQNMSIDTTVAVLNKTYIFGKDADTVTVDDVFNHITRLEAEAAKYDSIKNKPKAIKAKVDALKAEIESLVKFSDEKFSAE